jgi:hypothetical protein
MEPIFGKKYMHRITILILASLFAICHGALVNATETSKSSPNKRLVLSIGSMLYAYYEGQYHLIKEAELIYGYGWLDNNRVFVAYQKGRGEAVAELEVIDLRKSLITSLSSMGGVGESHFDVNPSMGDVVYNDASGIHVLKINPITNEYRIEDIKKDIICYGAFWVDNITVGCLVYKSGNKAELVKIVVPNEKRKGDARE